MEELFAGRHFDREVIVLCVRWYLNFKLSYRDLVEMMAERGLDLAYTTILRWVWRCVPEFTKHWNRFRKPAGRSWRVDEAYIKVRGQWTYLYRAVDKAGQTVDFRLSRDGTWQHPRHSFVRLSGMRGGRRGRLRWTAMPRIARCAR